MAIAAPNNIAKPSGQVRGGLESVSRLHDRTAMFAVLVLFCSLPFIQLGISYEISVQYLAFIVVAITVRKRLPLREWVIWAFVFVAMLLGLFWHLDAEALFGAILRNSREALGVLLIICAARNVSWSVPDRFLRFLLNSTIVGLFILTLAQFVTYTVLKKPQFFMPAAFFITGQDTIPDHWLEFGKLNGFLASVRVSATYSEPSYLSFVCLCLATIVRRASLDKTTTWVLLSLSLGTIALSKSASGVFLFVLFMAYSYGREFITPGRLLVLSGTLSAALLIAAGALDFNPLERIMDVTDPRVEPSGYIRLVMPLQHVATVLTESPFGVPWSELYNFFLQRTGDYSVIGPVEKSTGMWIGQDNGFLNLFIEFGWAGFVVIGGIVGAIRDRFVLLFLLFVTQFNGSPFGPDKVALICLALSCRPATVSMRPNIVRPGMN